MGYDLAVSGYLQQFRGFPVPVVMQAVSEIGRAPLVVVLIGVTVGFLYFKRLRLEALVLVGSTGLVSYFGWWLKYLVGRPRPGVGEVAIFKANMDPSFPSGHVLLYVVFLGFLFYLISQKIKSLGMRVLLQIVLGGLIVLIGPSRIYLGEHWFSDVLAAYLLGAAWLLGTIRLYHHF
jgi:undecaprenyl-diphosphatase